MMHKTAFYGISGIQNLFLMLYVQFKVKVMSKQDGCQF